MVKRWEKGTIYFVRFRDSGRVKIGFTKSLKKRLVTLENTFGLLDVLGIIDDMLMTDEVDTQRRFEHLNLSPDEAGGSYEMFLPGADLLAFIKESTDTDRGRALTAYLDKRRWRVGRNVRRISNQLAAIMRKEYDTLRPPIDELADRYRVSERYARRALLGKNHKHAGGPVQESLPDSY